MKVKCKNAVFFLTFLQVFSFLIRILSCTAILILFLKCIVIMAGLGVVYYQIFAKFQSKRPGMNVNLVHRVFCTQIVWVVYRRGRKKNIKFGYYLLECSI